MEIGEQRDEDPSYGGVLSSRVVKNDFLLRISVVCLQLRWSQRKNPQRISVDTPPVFSWSPPRFVETLKMLTTEPFFTTLLGILTSRAVLILFPLKA